uniref:Uncharacterized protein n=1 Tax=Trichuris muris TaxID=70415 RepID=A0A5S6PZU3_TRIMR
MRSILSRNQLSVTDVNVLFDAYHGRKASSVELIRDPVFMELLLESLFSYKSTLQEDVVPKYIFLLAFASVMIETREKVGFIVLLTFRHTYVSELTSTKAYRKFAIHFILLDEIATLHGYFHRKIFELYKVLFESDCNGYDVLSRLGRSEC